MTFTLSLSKWLIRNRTSLLLFNIVFAIAFGTQIPKVQIGNSSNEIGYEDNHYVQQNKLVEELFGEESDQLFIIVASKENTVLNNQTLKIIQTITDQVATLPNIVSTRSLTNTQLLITKGNELLLKPLIPDDIFLSTSELSELGKLIQADSDLSKYLLSNDFSLSPIIINYQLPANQTHKQTSEMEIALLDAVEKIITEVKQPNPNITIFPLSRSVSFLAQVEEIKNIIFYFTPIILIISCVSFWFLIRSVSALFLGLATLIILSEIIVLGMVGASDIALDQLSAMAPAIVILVMGANSIHVMSMFFLNLRKGEQQEEALINAMNFNLLPIFLTTLTTAIGFLSLNFSEVNMVMDLGNITAFGTVVAFALTLTAMPALLMLRTYDTPNKPLMLSSLMAKLGGFVVLNHSKIFTVFTSLIIISILGLTSLQINYFPSKQLNKGHPVRENIDFVDDRIPLRYPAVYVFASDDEEGVFNPTFLREVESFSEWYRDQPEALNVSSFSDLIKKTHKKMNNDSPEFESIPTSEEQIAQYILLLDFIGMGDLKTFGVSEDGSKLRVTVLTKTLNTIESQKIEDKAYAWLNENTQKIKLYALGGSYTWHHIFSKALKDLIDGAIYAAIAISIILMLAFRSIAYGVLSIVPNIFPALIIFGLWSYAIGHITFIEACIFSITIGIVVDDTVHFISKYLTFRKQENSFETAIIKTYETVGTALIITTATFTLGLFVLLFCYLHQITLIVKLMVPILYMALILDFFYLPSILLYYERFNHFLNRK